MEERIETKINEFIEGILAKDALTKEDYEILSAHLGKIKYEKENKERMKSMIEAFAKV